MKKLRLLLAILMAVVFAQGAQAEQQMVKIDGITYEFVVNSPYAYVLNISND